MRLSKNVKVLAASLTMVCGIAAAPAVAAGATQERAGAGHSVTAGAASEAGQLAQRVSGTWTDDSGKEGKVHGTVTPTSFKVSDDGQQLLMTADVVLRATGAGAPKGAVSKTITTPVKGATASGRGDGAVTRASTLAAPVPAGCNILSLDLGPLTLDVLGLVVVLQPVVLDIVAVPGAGNLLGNLLCAVAGLLDGGGLIPGLLAQIADLLNQILAALNLGTAV
jgi:hypothetical protein